MQVNYSVRRGTAKTHKLTQLFPHEPHFQLKFNSKVMLRYVNDLLLGAKDVYHVSLFHYRYRIVAEGKCFPTLIESPEVTFSIQSFITGRMLSLIWGSFACWTELMKKKQSDCYRHKDDYFPNAGGESFLFLFQQSLCLYFTWQL